MVDGRDRGSPFTTTWCTVVEVDHYVNVGTIMAEAALSRGDPSSPPYTRSCTAVEMDLYKKILDKNVP